MKGKKQWKLAVILLFVAVCGAFYLRIQDSGGKVELLPEDQYALEEKKETDTGSKAAGTSEESSQIDPLETGVADEEVSPAVDHPVELVIHVCGAVAEEGVYRLPDGSRVIDAIEAAGGLTEEAAGAFLNQADRLEDGIQVYIPSQEEAAEWEAGTASPFKGQALAEEAAGTAESGKVDLNTAGREELMSLPGIGESKAEAILSYRETKGGFQTVEELMEIPGIKEGVFRKIEERITIGHK